MSSSLDKVLVGDEIVLNYGKSLPERDRKNGIYFVFGSNGVVGSHSNFCVKGPGIVIGRKGSLGEITWTEEDFWPIDTTYFVSIKDKGDLKYWYYQLKSLDLQSLNSHAAVPGLNRENVYRISVNKRNESEQRRISKILNVLDQKIELNQKINKSLEEMGQALFKYYFIENPEAKNWEKKPLDEIADFLNGLASQKYPVRQNASTLPVIKIREMTGGVNKGSDSVSDFPEEYIVHNGDFLFAWSGTLMTKIWTEGEGALNQHIFKVTSKTYPKWFYYHWTNYYLQEFVAIAKSKAVTMGHIKRSHLSEALVMVPPRDFLLENDLILSATLEKQIQNSIQISTLVGIRDSLLPRLLSGEIGV